jgi:predicted lipopolysaccharide heptosyltransferase III
LYKIINRKKRIATIAVDYVGKIIFWPVKLFKRPKEIKPEEIKSILIIRTAYIGDVVMTLPILKPLKDKFPGAKISFLTSKGAGEVLTNNPYVDDIITYNPFWFYPGKISEYLKFIRQFKKNKFDLVIEARGDIREFLFLVRPLSAKFKISYDVGGGGYLLSHVVPYNDVCHRVEYHLDIIKYLGGIINGVCWDIYLKENEKKRVEEILRENEIRKPFISIHPGSRQRLKMWSAKRYALLADMLIKHYGMNVVLFGTKGEKGLVDSIVNIMKNKPVILAGKTNIREMAGIFSKSAIFICNDSAPMHVAAAVNTPTIAIFGPSKSVETGPYGNRNIVVEKNYPCRFTCDESSCLFDIHNACMTDIAVEDVFSAVKKLLV